MMEKTTLKTGIYSLVISFFIMTLSFKNSYEVVDEDGEVFIESIGYADFFFNVFRYSIGTSLLFTYLAFFIFLIQRKTDRIVEVINNEKVKHLSDRL